MNKNAKVSLLQRTHATLQARAVQRHAAVVSAAVLFGTMACSVGEADDTGADRSGLALPSAQSAAQTAIQISTSAPTRFPKLPSMTAAEQTALFTVTLDSSARPGTKDIMDLRSLIDVPKGAPFVARAVITSAFKTANLPAGPSIPFFANNVATLPTYQNSAFAAQVYECRVTANGGIAWAFARPEAGLVPIVQGQDLGNLDGFVMDHFRFPGDAARGVPAGPAWRVSNAALNQGVAYAGQAYFVGAAEATIPNGTATGTAGRNIPALRVRNVGGFTAAIPNGYFPVTDPIGRGYSAFLLRLNTQGGVAPSTGCQVSASDLGKTVRVPYSTEYYFVEVRPETTPPPPAPPEESGGGLCSGCGDPG
jgi:Protein of unknown function (DUF3455)